MTAALYPPAYWLTVAAGWIVAGFWTVDLARDRRQYDPALHLLLVALWPLVALLVAARALHDPATLPPFWPTPPGRRGERDGRTVRGPAAPTSAGPAHTGRPTPPRP